MQRLLRHITVLILGTLSFAGAARADSILYGITLENLVVINQNDPSQVSVVGATGLSAQGLVQPLSLAWNPTDRYLYGIGYDQLTEQASLREHQYLFRVDPLTGAGQTVKDLGDPNGPGTVKYQGLEYVDALHSLVVTWGPGENQIFLGTITTGGDVTLLLTDNLDRDWAVYDTSTGRFFTIVIVPTEARMAMTDLGTGTVTPMAPPLPWALMDMAYNPADGFIYGQSTNFRSPTDYWLYKISTEGGASVVVSQEHVAGDPLFGLAFATDIPEPATWLTLCGALAALALCRRFKRA